MVVPVPEVTLVGGEKVQLDIYSVMELRQTFVRLSKTLVAGIVNGSLLPGIYLWREQADGSYAYAGDIMFEEDRPPEGLVIWNPPYHAG